MNHYGAKNLAESFRTVRKNTIVIAEEIGEEHYGFVPAPGTRSVAALLAHMALATRAQLQMHLIEKSADMGTFDFMGFFTKLMEDEKLLTTKPELLAALTTEGERFAGFLDTLDDNFLAETVTFPPPMQPPSKTRIEMLMSAKEHEMHHRGQLMLIERLLGHVPHFTRQMEAFIAEYEASRATMA